MFKKIKTMFSLSKKRQQGRPPQRIGHGAWKQIRMVVEVCTDCWRSLGTQDHSWLWE